MTQALFLMAYAVSGLAGLVYEVSWTRMLTLEMGRGVAASSTVLAAFMGGLALGAAAAGRWAAGLTAYRALRAYAGLELAAAVLALAFPFELRALVPVFSAVYGDGTGSLAFGLVRLVASLALLLLPAMVLGATFPVAVRWFAADREDGSRLAGRLYAANTIGAAIGSVLAGFVLVPLVGVFGSLLLGAAASLLAMCVALMLASRVGVGGIVAPAARDTHEPIPQKPRSRRAKGMVAPARQTLLDNPPRIVLAASLLSITGAATFAAEVAWTRVLSLLVGPSTYAFAATAAVFISGLALGAMAGTILAARARRPVLAAGLMLGLAALASIWASRMGGTWLPQKAASDFAGAPAASVVLRSLVMGSVVLPMVAAIGAAFPICLRVAGGLRASPRSIGAVYAINTLAAVVGSLVAGFVLIPAVGLEWTLAMVSGLLALGAVLAASLDAGPRPGRGLVLGTAVASLALLLRGQSWDRELLASGSYKYASAIVPGLDLETALKSGTLVYYRDGAAATVSVKRLTGALSLAIDGKIDASTGGDMLTQKLLAHLPLLLHGAAREICIIGLGSGVTLASALTHPVQQADVLEISPEVVEASRLFAEGGRQPLDDRRTRLLVTDARTHLSLSDRTYDVIVSEPSNPWMAGVAALFTREFFEAARKHLAEAGVICQWVNTYDISSEDLKSVVATFITVFPHVTMWLAGDGDLMLIGANTPMEPRLEQLAGRWSDTAVAADLQSVAIASPFGVQSLFVGGDEAASRFAGGAGVQTDSRMALEFSAPRALHTAARRDNVNALRSLVSPAERPPSIARAWREATADDFAKRATMLRRAGAYETAFDAAREALNRSPDNGDALQILVDSSAPLGRQREAEALLASTVAAHPALTAPRVALSKLRAATGAFEPAIAVITDLLQQRPDDVAALEQLASIFADAGDAERLGRVVAALSGHEQRAGSAYYAAAHHFLRGELDPALSAAERALAIDPRFARAQNLVGAIQATRGDTAAARKAFEASLALDSQDPATYQNLALLELNSGTRAAAARLFAEALSLDPGSEAARQGLARARGDLGSPG
jgi:spermidine synthase